MPFSKKITRLVTALLLVTFFAFSFGCSGQRDGSSGKGGEIRLQGAGSTFVNPLMQKWLSEYGKITPNVRIDYQSIGSGEG